MRAAEPRVAEPAPQDARVADDALARRLLQSAHGAFQKWPEGFVGFASTVRCHEGDREVVGDVRVFAGGRVESSVPHPALQAWAEGSLRSIALARTPRFFRDGEGRFPITFESPEDHSLGRCVRVDVGGGAWRTYRIDPKGRIRQQQNTGPTKRVSATYDELVRTCPGRVVPTRIHILEWDVSTETALTRADIEDAYCCLDHVWLPIRRRAVVSDGAASRKLSLELSHLVVL